MRWATSSRTAARAIICQDILHEKVIKSGAALDLTIVTNVNEYRR